MDVKVISEGFARVVVIDRPARRNALAPETLTALRKVAVTLGRDRDARGIVLTGSEGGGVWLSGGDLHALEGMRTAVEARTMARKAHAAVDALRATGLPLVAAIHGDAYGGGCELAAACDVRVCSEGVRFHWTQARFGVTTGWGGTANLLALVPRGTAARWLLTARPVTVDEARAEGFVDVIAPVGQARRAAVAMIEDIARHPKGAVAGALVLLRAGGGVLAGAARRLELAEFGKTWASEAHHEAVAGFTKRQQ